VLRGSRAAPAAGVRSRWSAAEARRKTEEAAASNPFRASLWQQYRDQIAARRAVLASRQAYHDTGGDWRHAERLLGETRQIDARIRGRAIWNQDLPAPSAVVREHAGTRAAGDSARPGDGQHRNPQQEREPGRSSFPPIERQRSNNTRQTGQASPPEDPGNERESRATGDVTSDGVDGRLETAPLDTFSWPAPNPRTAAEPDNEHLITKGKERCRMAGVLRGPGRRVRCPSGWIVSRNVVTIDLITGDLAARPPAGVDACTAWTRRQPWRSQAPAWTCA
jgi:hypothetical protein